MRGTRDAERAAGARPRTGAKTGVKRNRSPPPTLPKNEPLVITSLNVASFNNRMGECKGLDPDVFCVQETALTATVQREIELSLGRDAWGRAYERHWGKPQPGRVGGGVVSLTVAQRGGVATFVKRPRASLRCSAGDELEAYKSRCVHTKVSLDGSKRWLHVLNVYCPAGNEAVQAREREQLLHHILVRKRIELGDVPIVVIGDLNCEEDRSPTLEKALASDWVDAAAACAALSGATPESTLKRTNSHSRIDRALLNPLAAQFLIRCWVHDGVEGSDHRCLSLELGTTRIRRAVLQYSIPREIPEVAMTEEDPEPSLADSIFERCIQDRQVDEAYREWARLAEEHLMRGFAGTTAGAYLGRGETRLPKLRELCPPATEEIVGAVCDRQRKLGS
eukprot:TRINITY_DN2191_c0_g2_i3.p1 TRINITY_DN2191_c0_g2~~TRINITY_DN2191_c0_g2_i3.p1  ORF type:complete len:393 (+),score=60.89 TRINITY_DN2191_c0_g2_i3:714-1892(+)